MSSITIDHVAVAKLKKKLEQIQLPLDKDTATKIGKEVVTEMKDMISKGISPIQSVGRFEGYKNPEKYPGDRKPKRPVNLRLTGDFLNNLKFQVISQAKDYFVRVGFFDRDSQLKEEGHRVGHNRQPKRPTIPEGNEQLAQRIQRIISGLLRERIRQIIK